jgi:hypothetical protein
MNIRFLLASIALVVASSAGAQVQRAFVASTGNDANPCSRTQPCRNFAAAVAAVVDAGEVVVLDSAGYGTVTIGKSVSLIAPPGVYAGIAAPSATGILINAPADAVVSIRGLTINGDVNTTAVWAMGIGRLHVDDCVFINDGDGVLMDSAGELFVSHSSFRENGGAIDLDMTGTFQATGTVDHCRFENNSGGGFILGAAAIGSSFTIRDSLFVGNVADGVFLSGAEVNVENCSFAKNGNAIEAQNNGNTFVTVSGSMLVDNQIAFLNDGSATFTSYGDNALTGNVTATNGTMTTGAKQ